MLKVAAGAINSRTLKRGNFDTWYRDLDEQFDFTSKDIKAKRHHILAAAFSGLSQQGRDLLAQIATFGTAVKFEILNAFNPFLPPRPVAVQAPSREPVNLRNARQRQLIARTDDERLHWLEVAEQAEKELQKAQTAYIEYRRSLNAWDKSPAYKRGIQEFETLFHELEGRGLLWWEVQTDSFDLHPVVRGYVYHALSHEERRMRHNQTYSLFESQEQSLNTDNATTLVELNVPIQMYNNLIGAGFLDKAAQLYNQKLRSPLRDRIGAYQKAYELLVPLFTEGIDQLPTIQNIDIQSSCLNDMEQTLHYLDRTDDALKIQLLYIKLKLDAQHSTDLITALGNYTLSLIYKNHIAQALNVLQYCRDISARRDNLDEIAKTHYYSLYINNVLANWSKADSSYQSFMGQPPKTQTALWTASVERTYAETLFKRGAAIQDVQLALNKALRLAVSIHDALELRRIDYLQGEIYLKSGDLIQAIIHFQDAIGSSRQAGTQDKSAFGGLARAYIAQGAYKAALNIIQSCDNYSAAYVYQVVGQVEQAIEYAHKYYSWAWAHGEPYVRRYDLNQARELLASLGEPTPNLPAWDKSTYEKFPYEDEVRAFIEKLKA